MLTRNPEEIMMLIEELIRVGQKAPDGRSTSTFLNIGKARAREIGERLNQIDGNELMLAVHSRVSQSLGGSSGRELEVAWDGIGEWMG